MRMFGRVPATATAAMLNPPQEQVETGDPLRVRQQPGGTLLASAKRLTSESLKARTWGISKTSRQGNWQEDAWDMLDLVGEQRFLANTLASRLAQARLFVGYLNPDSTTDEPEPIEDEEINNVLEALGGSMTGRAQMLKRLSVNMFVAGEGWLAGIPTGLLPEEYQSKPVRPGYEPGDLYLEDLEWRMLSTSEVSADATGMVKMKIDSGLTIESVPDNLYLIRVWSPHPRESWEADSPTRSSLPVLRELVGLTMHISAQVDSRLAGAGLLLVPSSASEAIKAAAGQDPDSNDDPFTESLIEAMITPINDRANASALVPLVVTVPDESTEKFKYMTFSSELDAEARELRDEAIRRLALGQDAPPELLLGTGSMNHWGAWLVREDVVSTHIEPHLALICDALTTQYLHPALDTMGVADPENYVVWYDVSHMITRPDRAGDAMSLHEKGVLSDGALRDAAGFDDNDSPQESLAAPETPEEIVLEMVRSNPALVSEPGVDRLIEQVARLLGANPTEQPGGDPEMIPEGEPDLEEEGGGGILPETNPGTIPDSAPIAASGSRSVRGRGGNRMPGETQPSSASKPLHVPSYVGRLLSQPIDRQDK